ncbi:uncharacterized protein LOC125597349 [Brassica napus]|uniref:uncharacterized protein LOC125597349 n=1 Tax=Brassica napus TaxID=3708 RepID=UPI0020788DED|nr:uncharacterized protein LOC125597349 [Brassica napus]
MNTLYFKSLFREDLYRNPTTSVQDAIARSNNFIRMEEDTTAILKKLNTAAKPATAPKAPEARQELRQHTSGNKPNQPKSFVYVVEDKNPPPGPTVVVREKGWNVWENDEKPQTSSTPSTSSPGSAEPNLWFSFHKSKVHDTRSCRHLVDALFSSYEKGTSNVKLPKPRPNSTKSWSKSKEKKAHKNHDKSGTRQSIRRMTSQKSRTKMRVKHKSKKSNLVIVDVSKSSSHDQVPPLMKKRTNKSMTHTSTPAITSRKWPSKPENDPSITFSPDDAIGVHLPHNDPLLVEVGITKCDVAKVLIDTGSLVDLIFRDTLDKMGVDLRDMKPSSRSLTGFNGAFETMIGMIKLPVYACGVTRTVKFSCVKFLGPNGQVQTLRGEQQATRDLLIATVKMQQSTPRINAVAKQNQPQKDEILEVTIDDSDESKVV